jgi:hypothetical protein
MLLLLVAALGVLLASGMAPGRVLFSNDGPLGRLCSECHQLPGRFLAGWQDLNIIGFREGRAPPSLSYALMWLLKPIAFAKFYAPLALLVLGLGAWCFLRQLRLAPTACLLGGLAAALNSSFFSAACWGVAAHALAIGLTFFALAALAAPTFPKLWWRVVLAGFAVGMAVMEGADIGALFSIYVAGFVVFQTATTAGPRARNWLLGAARLTLVVACAAWLAADGASELVATNIQGVAEAEQDAQTKAARWDWATQWSLPKREALGLFVPGLFGYRMEAPNGACYWGTVGRDPTWYAYFASDRQGPEPKGFKRYGGGGCYAGMVVVLVGIWAAVKSCRRQDSVFSLAQRQWIWFWTLTGIASLLLSFGRFAPFYRWLYALPYFSTIRNPTKFLHLLTFALVIVFAYGVDGLCRRYLSSGPAMVPRRSGLANWWPAPGTFERKWLCGCLLAVGLSIGAWIGYDLSRAALQQYLEEFQFDPSDTADIANFSIHQAGFAVLWLLAATALMAALVRGAFAGRRARWGGICLGIFLVADLARANAPWVFSWDYTDKYASNPIIDRLRVRPYLQRVALVPLSGPGITQTFGMLYRVEWLQHLFPYYNIQALDVSQMPRKPKDLADFDRVFSSTNETEIPRLKFRLWQLTNTRWLLGPADLAVTLNDEADPIQRRFRTVERFGFETKPGHSGATRLQDLTTVPSSRGPLALLEFTGALPRAQLYSRWEIQTNEAAWLKRLNDPAFDPEQTVLVAGGRPSPPNALTNTSRAGSVEFEAYAPKHVVLSTQTPTPALLLLNNHFDPNWHVRVDGQNRALLRCNYVMQGVLIDPGSHTVEFEFTQSLGPLYASLSAIGTALLLLAFVVVCRAGAAPLPVFLPRKPATASAAR